jgi:hypothetical protein
VFASSEPQKVVLSAHRMQDLTQLTQLMNHHEQCFKSSVILKSFPSMHPGLPAMLVDELNRPWPHMLAMHSAPSTEIGSASSHCSDSEVEMEDGQGRTSVILKNIPDGCDRAILLKTLMAEKFLNSVNFLYLPMAFDRKETASFRYAFISFTTPECAKRFHNHFSGFTNWDQALPNVGSGCITEWCALQGCASHIARYRNSPMMHPSVEDHFKPILLRQGQRLPFPPPTVEIKPPRQRRHHHLHTK